MACAQAADGGQASGVLPRGGQGREHILQDSDQQRAVEEQREGSRQGGEQCIMISFTLVENKGQAAESGVVAQILRIVATK